MNEPVSWYTRFQFAWVRSSSAPQSHLNDPNDDRPTTPELLTVMTHWSLTPVVGGSVPQVPL